MALNFTVKVGDLVFVDGRRLLVKASNSPVTAMVEIDDGTLISIRDDRAAEVYPQVMLSVGLKSTPGGVSLVFSAPKEIRIWRDGHAPEGWKDASRGTN